MESPLTGYIKAGNPPSMEEYLKAGGYEAAGKAIRSMTPAEVIDVVKSSGLAGRGGAGFPTGLKWSLVPKDEGGLKYLVANADEMEPGSFKDRYLMEGNPHQLLEGMIISSYATGVQRAYIFIRWAYKKATRLLRKAIEDAYSHNFLGSNIYGTGYSLDIYLHESAGRYICGEETALLNSLEGKRGIPRSKPPFPAGIGLFGRPTVINNIETLCNVPHIISNGAEWFKKLSLTGEGGTKIYGVSGRVKNPGLWELPMGTTLRELLYDHAGGMQEGYEFRGAIPGGASTDFLLPAHLDVKMDFAAVKNAGSRLGTGTIIVLDNKTCPVAFIHNMIKFFAAESCGWCTPCREGLPWVEKILDAVDRGEGIMQDLAVLHFHTRYLGPGNTFCAHAPGAMEPLQSGLKYFHEDFVRHIEQKRCTYR